MLASHGELDETIARKGRFVKGEACSSAKKAVEHPSFA